MLRLEIPSGVFAVGALIRRGEQRQGEGWQIYTPYAETFTGSQGKLTSN